MMADYRDGPKIEKIAGDWESLEKRWEKVVNSEKKLGSRSGGWHVKKEYSGEGMAPIAGDPDEITIYLYSGHSRWEVGRWKLSEVQNVTANTHESVGDSDD